MKKILFCAALILLACTTYKRADAQVHLSLGFNINSQPAWGPVGYTHAEYYYMPDVDAYYDVPRHQYVYFDNGQGLWIHAAYLPERYHFDPYHSYKVVINQRNPWERHDVYRARYYNYRGRYDQDMIRDSRDDRYRNHWHEDNGHDGGGHYDNGNHNGDRKHWGRDRDHGDHDN